jgi:DNA recombination protein RmuC
MAEFVTRIVLFIENHAPEPAQSLAVLMLLAVLILLVILIRRKPQTVVTELRREFLALESKYGHIENAVKDEIRRNREETRDTARLAREELGKILQSSNASLQQRLLDSIRLQRDQLDSFAKQLIAMAKLNEDKLEAMRRTLEIQLRTLQADNTRQLEKMRITVDEKLQNTLEKRLGDSFRQVSERLEQVHKGLGEMHSLAAGVGDLKKVLTNVKTRGTWGEIRLGHILEQILTPEQYAANVATKKNSRERVEFAVRLPGPAADGNQVVWLPIDAKFPQEDYQRLVDAQEAADKELADKSLKSLESRIKLEARSIRDKYIDPPHTTDFALMFLPVEGLYAEVLRQPGLCDMLQREHRIVVTGPTTLAALLNSLQMGFRTLAIEKRSSEVWELLGAVKSEFGRFGHILAQTKKKLQEASNTIGKAEVRTRAIERRLTNVQAVPHDEATGLIGQDEER